MHRCSESSTFTSGPMDADVILISDSESEDSVIFSPDNKGRRENEGPLTVSSVSPKSLQLPTDSCPVTWSSSSTGSNSQVLSTTSFLTPSPRLKVTHWLSVNHSGERPALESATNLDNLPVRAQSKSLILLRQDYKKLEEKLKDVKKTTALAGSSSDSKLLGICARPENKSQRDKLLLLKKVESTDGTVTCMDGSITDQPAEIGSSHGLTNFSKKEMPKQQRRVTENGNSQELSSANSSVPKRKKPPDNVPLSPETQKKYELCEYLKLMNPADAHAVAMQQNRRSIRVKYLALMSEKRKLERKLNSEPPLEEKKKSSKSADVDSKHNEEKVIRKRHNSSPTSSVKSLPSLPQKPTEEAAKPKSENQNNVKIPLKFLQVPEISTTSITKPNFDTNVSRPKRKTNNPEVITKKSFEQLHMNVDDLRPMKWMRVKPKTPSFVFLAKYASNLPNEPSDFDDAMNSFIKWQDLKQMKIRREKMLPQKKRKSLDEEPQTKIQKLNGVLKVAKENSADEESKAKEPDVKPKAVYKKKKKLNARLELKRLKITDLSYTKMRMRRHRKWGALSKARHKITKRMVNKRKKATENAKGTRASPVENLTKEKTFKTAELIQHGPETATSTISLAGTIFTPPTPKKDERSEECRCPKTKVRKRLPEANVWRKYFTSEHRKAYLESRKFLEEEETPKEPEEAPAKPVFETVQCIFEKVNPAEIAEKEVQPAEKEEEEVESSKPENNPVVEDKAVEPEAVQSVLEVTKMNMTYFGLQPCKVILETCAPLLQSCSVSVQTACASNRQQISSEDREVDLLMNTKDQATQKSDDTAITTLNSTSQDKNIQSTSATSNLPLTPASHDGSSVATPVCVSEDTTNSSDKEIGSSEKPEESKAPTAPLETNQNDSSTKEPEVFNISDIEPATCSNVQEPVNGAVVKSLHQCLTQPKKIKSRISPVAKPCWNEETNERSPKSDRKSTQSHSIYLSNSNGAILNAFYVDCNLIVVQELMISFWMQSPLGNILGAQDMWIPMGSLRRLVLGNGCVQKESSESVISTEGTIAYVELWTKEHKSDKRERPVADIFITIYIRLNRSAPDKKVLQLENIHGHPNDVQYIVLSNSRSIVVSWSVTSDEVSSTLIHCYHLSSDYQMVTSITKMQTVSHYVASVHNIEDCDTLILGCGDHQLTLWDLEQGYIVATIDLLDLHPDARIVWAKRDRGFLFTLHHCSDGVLQLIAINSFDSTWKRLQTYKPEFDYENLLGVSMENGLLIAFYDTGVSCWSAQMGVLVVDDTSEDNGILLPYGKHVIVILNNQVHVRHALEYLITNCPVEDS